MKGVAMFIGCNLATSAIQERLKVCCEFQRVLKCQEVIALLGLGIDVEHGAWDN
jgi:hypothetical protein